jgi:ribosomal protein L11 methyltransferase
MKEESSWLKLTVFAPGAVLEALSVLLVDWGAEGVEEGEGAISAYYRPAGQDGVEAGLRRLARDLEEGDSLPEPFVWRWAEVREEDWWESWKAHFRPTRVSPRLAVCPSWEAWSAPEGVRVLRLDPGRAFGTGTHETTRLCLRLLDEEQERRAPATLLDVGSGSGILSVAGLILGIPRVVAIDIDPVAAGATRDNAVQNGVDAGLLVACGDPRTVRGSYPLVVANILYQALLGLAPVLAERVSGDGRLLLSGMLACELPSARNVYARVGLSAEKESVEGDWGALVLRRASQI